MYTHTYIHAQVMSFLTAIIFWYEVNGYSKLYDGFANGVAYEVLTMALFLVFTDFCIYWIHRGVCLCL
jgi:lathosterol oxidase